MAKSKDQFFSKREKLDELLASLFCSVESLLLGEEAGVLGAIQHLFWLVDGALECGVEWFHKVGV